MAPRPGPPRTRHARVGPPTLADRFLVPGEHPVIVVRRHMIVLIRPMMEFIAGATILTWLARTADSDTMDRLVGWLLVGLALRTVYEAAWWDRERITITDKRLLLTNGIFTAKVAVMPISKITDLSFRQSTLGLLTGYGELTIESAGQNQALNVLNYLPEPQLVYETISQVVHTSRGGRGHYPSGPPPSAPYDTDDPDDLLLPPWVNGG